MSTYGKPTRVLAILALGATMAFIPTASIASSASTPDSSAPSSAIDGKQATRVLTATATARSERTEGIAGGYVFVPIAPYRTYDSRQYVNGFLPAGYTDYFDVLTDEFGNPKIPAEAVAVTYNLAIDQTQGFGYLGMFPANVTWPGNASINWTSWYQTLSNGGTVAIGFLDAAGQVAITAGGSGGTHYILDITGYYI